MIILGKEFQQKHPKAAQWIREGGLFVIVCNDECIRAIEGVRTE